MEYAAARRLFPFVLYCRAHISKDTPLNQIGILLLVASKEPAGATMAGISHHLHLSQSSTSKNVKMMSDWSSPDGSTRGGRGLIRLEQDMNERPRLIRVHLTEKGREVLEALESALADGERSLREEVTP